MKNLPQISEAEFEVMKIVWKYAPISTRDITEKLLQTTNWSPKTGTHLRKTKPYVYLHPGSKRKRIYWTGKQFFSKTLLQWGYYSYGFCIYRK